METTSKTRQRIRVLLLEDNSHDAELTIRELRKAGYEPEWKCVETEAAFLTALADEPDLVLSDFSMPHFDGMWALTLLRTRGLDIPFILVSGVLGEEFVVTAMQAGADDYILKSHLARLGSAVARSLKNKQLRDEFCRAEIVRRESEASVRELAQTQSSILDALPAHIVLLDRQGVIVAVNDAWRRFAIGNQLQGPAFALGVNYLDVCERAQGTGSEEASAVAEGIRRVLRRDLSEFSIEYPCHSATERRWFQLTVTPLGQSHHVGVVVMHVNITDRKLAEVALRTIEQEQRHLARQLAAERSRLLAAQSVAKVGSWETDLETLTVTWSEETFRIFETTPDRFRPTHDGFLEFVHPDDRAEVQAAFVESTVQTGPFAIEHRIVLPDQKIKFVEERWKIYHNDEGKPDRATGTCQDITDRRALQQELLQTQKMTAIGQLAGGVAHDFNNLLTVILGYAELLIESLRPEDPAQEFLEEIKKAGERSSALTRQLLAFSRQQVVIPKIVNLNDVVRNTEKMLRRLIGEDIEFTAVLHPDLETVKADSGQLEQILLNLAVNARDAMPHGGKLTIETSNVRLDEEYAKTHSAVRPGPYVMLSVSDSGAGMTDEIKRRIFEPFFTTKEIGKGTGLGLAVVHGIVKQNDGHVEVHSEPGHGTCFTFYLPCVQQHARPGSSIQGLTPNTVGTETILLVEDEAGLRSLARHALEKCGYRVLVAGNGNDALGLCAKHDGPIHLLLTDVVMPGLGGRQLAEQVISLYPQIQVLYMSGYTDDTVVRHGIRHEQVNFLQKPFSPTALTQKVRQLLS